MKTTGFVGRLMSILKRVKHEVSVDDYIAHFVETARISNKWVSRVDFEREDHFLMMMFVTGLKERNDMKFKLLNLSLCQKLWSIQGFERGNFD